MKIQYVGPFWKIEAEGIAMTRYLPVEADSKVCAKLLLQKDSNGKSLFETVASPAKVLAGA